MQQKRFHQTATMASSGNEAAIKEMVQAKFTAKPIDRIVGRPSHATVRHMIEQLAPIAAKFDTDQWGGEHGCLFLVLGGTKFRAFIADNSVANAPMVKPAANATFVDGGDDTKK